MPGPAWIIILLFKLPHVAGMISMQHHTQLLLVEMESRELLAGAGLKP
jgi:hypothetical protein